MWGHLHEEFDSSSDAASLAGKCLDTWLTELGWPTEELDRLLLAVSAAIDNSCTHAYRDEAGVIDVRAGVLSGPSGIHRLSITVSDRGVWSDPDPRTSGGGTRTLRGLAVMRANLAHLRLDGNAAGTRVHMISSPVRLKTYALRRLDKALTADNDSNTRVEHDTRGARSRLWTPAANQDNVA